MRGVRGTARRGPARRGEARRGEAFRAWQGWAWPGEAGRGGAFRAWLGRARRGVQGAAWHGAARLGEAGRGVHGVAGLGRARRGAAWRSRRGRARPGAAWRGEAFKAWQGEARLGVARPGWARRGVIVKNREDGRMAPKVAEKVAAPIVLRQIERIELIVPIIGTSPLIPHKWSEKALRMMRGKQGVDGSGAVREKREAKIAEDEAEGCQYYLADGTPGIPATAFKAAIVGACRLFEGLTMVMAKQAVFVVGEGVEQLVRIEGERTLREDTPRNATGVADLRYRYAYYPWRTSLLIRYLPSVIDPGSIGTLIDAAGNGGVGDWRPSAPKSATGTFGCFEVDFEALNG